MRIDSGERKGFIIKTPKNIRPTSSFIKKSIFDTLGNYILNKEVLEIFAGSGALGFEALSRGAKSCIFVDISRGSEKVILENIEFLKYKDRATFIRMDALKFLKNYNYKFDIIISDPPYNYENYSQLLKLSKERLKEEGMLILQLSSKTQIKTNDYKIYKDYIKGETRVLFLYFKI